MWIYCVEILFKVINGSIYDMFQMKMFKITMNYKPYNCLHVKKRLG